MNASKSSEQLFADNKKHVILQKKKNQYSNLLFVRNLKF